MSNAHRFLGAEILGLAFAATLIVPLTAVEVPQELPSGISANETSAIDSLRSIFAAQVQVKAAFAIETNCDHAGEYGYLAELAGGAPVRVCGAGLPAAGVQGIDEIDPPLIPPRFGDLTHSSAVHDGYRFQLWLPSHSWGPGNQVIGVAEDVTGGKLAAPFPDPANGAELWCCYAWPVDVGVTGMRAFFVDQDGVVLQWANDSATPYTGVRKTPDFGEAYENGRSMASNLRIGPPSGGTDGTIWTEVWP